MAITPTEIAGIAKLARIGLRDNEIEPLTTRLNSILNMVEQLQNADTRDVAPMDNPHDACQRLRADVVTESDQRERFQAIAPQTEDGLYLVPKVID